MARRRSSLRAVLSILIAAAALSATVAWGAPAGAADDRVLILASTVDGGASSIEATQVASLGLTPELVSDATWESMTTAEFAGYRAIILGDANCSSTAPAIVEETASVWGPAVDGNMLINGTDPVFHADQGGAEMTQRSVDFVVSDASKTGFYASLSCYYHGTAPATPVPMLDGLVPGGFTVTGVGCYNNAHIVASHPALEGLTDEDLSNWNCSVHEAFETWPPGFVPLAMAQDFGAAFTASDGTIGTPYVLAAGAGLKSFSALDRPL